MLSDAKQQALTPHHIIILYYLNNALPVDIPRSGREMLLMYRRHAQYNYKSWRPMLAVEVLHAL